MSSIAIKVEELSKAYQLGQIGTGTVSRDIERWWARLRGKDDPFLKIGEQNDRTIAGKSGVVWSLKDISFDIQQGEAVGIIGRNGAGKSTLLKILSRVTAPTTGTVKTRGRVASLLEVGTGFHPELTGRENIFLNGAILGMRKKEISKKLDEIIDFSGVERYIDTPVKRYSSGMYVRLAFAVAAHLDAEILIVDEVLAVGDAEFQKKCLGKMGEVSKGSGRTILFVSHNMAAIKALCNHALVLDKGGILANSDSSTGIRMYLNSGVDSDQKILQDAIQDNSDEYMVWKQVEVQQQHVAATELDNNKPFDVVITYELKTAVRGFRLFADIADDQQLSIAKTFFDEAQDTGTNLEAGTYRTVLQFPADLLIEGQYSITLFAGIHGIRLIRPVSGIPITISMVEMGLYKRRRFEEDFRGKLTLPLSWSTQLVGAAKQF
jgi:lipopolysaccharide transport system ATP-binding protein